MAVPERTKIGGSLEIPRIINGLWQLAGGHDKEVHIDHASKAMDPLILAGLDAFDVADHYGNAGLYPAPSRSRYALTDAELVIRKHHASSGLRALAFTKWCPEKQSVETVQRTNDAVERALRRMGQGRIALLQYHCWDYSDQMLIPHMDQLRQLQVKGKIQLLGVTNMDSAHLEMLIDSGFKIATNQVSCSVIDRRVVCGRMSKICKEHDVGILAYGTLLGGFISEKWLGAPEPMDEEGLNWSLRKYLRFIKAAGGWEVFQEVLQALSVVAKRHGVSISAVAIRHILDIPAVSAVIVGTRLSSSSSKYTRDTLAAFSFRLDEEDRALIAKAQEKLKHIPGDCGDEYRRAPFLTAKGDLSDHLEPNEEVLAVTKAVAEGKRIEYCSGGKWESIAGYCRAVRTGNTVRVTGTIPNSPVPSITIIGGSSASSQTVAIFDSIDHALRKVGSSLKDVVRTRVIIRNKGDNEAVARVHGLVFGCLGVKPAATLIIAGIVGEAPLVEIEAEAEVGCGDNGILSLSDTI